MLRLAFRLVAPLALIASGTAALSPAHASECKQVRGHLEETLVGAPCASPVGLCTVAQMFGAIQGEALFTASAIIASATPDVVFVTGDTVIVDAKLAGHRGTLTVQNAAAFRAGGEGDLADVQTVTGGTGDFEGATGSLRISGNFIIPTGGSSTYEGVVCLP